MDWQQQLRQYSQQPLSTSVLLGMLKDYHRPYDKIMEMVAQGYLKQIRRGLYIPTALAGIAAPEPFLVANHLYGPSYISTDSALHYWGLIPERVYEVSSITMRSSKNFQTSIGHFSFKHVQTEYYPVGVQSIHLTEQQNILIASPEKSLTDKVITTAGLQLRSVQQVQEYLLEDLRIEKDQLKKLDSHLINSWLDVCPKRNSIQKLVQFLSKI
jgi:predicted transcriptional regulator of viral defense system